MTSRLHWLWQQMTRRLWFRATAFSVLAVATALVAGMLDPYIPPDIPGKIGAQAVDGLLTIIATSMLSVTIFSLSTVVAAHAQATSHATPRATRLLSQDPTAQNALSTFVGTFLYSLVGLIALQTGLYGSTGRLLIYIVTLVVILLVVVTLLRWIDHVLQLGRVSQTAGRVEKAAERALRERREHPNLGGYPFPSEDDLPQDATRVEAPEMGYVQHVDMDALHDRTRQGAIRIYVLSPPGAYVHPRRPLALVTGPTDEKDLKEICEAFSIGDTRSFDQDPRFGLTVLAEIASRALSPGVNDPGTAIDVLGRAARVLATWTQVPPRGPASPPRYPFVYLREVNALELFDDLFTPIARDGAGTVEVAVRLQETLGVLAGLGDDTFTKAALHGSALALERAEQALTLDDDLRRVREAADGVRVIAQAAKHPR
ncbi:DUF2254 domain-containing protein [Cognatilysobacter bugurensis]|uniref:DUF2254 domain-containing protein n=1 Tax=Cognatilysobacter bugurensis TaxID=543356 RepID=A0A918SYQ0_9GAMM|nr:DUF2254 domain-containing protein [Lysobacter bugurensis]GHA73777.1 hypothetical protein GCM10007067_08280 [Lysobacter bugurensis]